MTVLSGGGVRYLLRDEFTTDRAAGAVNGTAPEPGPGGNRVVTDIASGITIASGRLEFANPGAPAHGQEHVTYDGIARTAGRVIIVKAHADSVSGNQYPLVLSNALAVNLAGAGTIGHAFYLGGADILVASGGEPSADHGDFADGVDYYFAIVLKATGAFFFIKGGAFTDWTLLHENSTDTEATLYPAIAQYNGAFSVDFIRIPAELWTPAGTDYSRLDRYIT